MKLRHYHCSVYNFTPFMNYPHFSTYLAHMCDVTESPIFESLTHEKKSYWYWHIWVLAPWYEIVILKVVWNLMNPYHLWIQVCPMFWRFISIFSVWYNQGLCNEIMTFSNMVFDIKKNKKTNQPGITYYFKAFKWYLMFYQLCTTHYQVMNS